MQEASTHLTDLCVGVSSFFRGPILLTGLEGMSFFMKKGGYEHELES